VDQHAISNLQQLRDVYPPPKPRTLDKEIDHLDEHCSRFISLSPFAVVNVLENPRVGVLFMIPGMGETLRVNGGAELTREPALLVGLQTGGHPAKLALVVHAEEVYIHCAKALIRSHLWDPETWCDPDELPSAAEILCDHIGIGDVEASAAALAEGYRTQL
jgi:hypothetical protein